MAVSELEHLREELDVDEAAAAFLEIKSRFIFAGELAFHTHAQIMNFADAFRREANAIGALFDDALDCLAESGVAGDEAGLDQGLALPQLRGAFVILAIG